MRTTSLTEDARNRKQIEARQRAARRKFVTDTIRENIGNLTLREETTVDGMTCILIPKLTADDYRQNLRRALEILEQDNID